MKEFEIAFQSKGAIINAKKRELQLEFEFQ